MKVKSIFISDVHLGTRGCSADALCAFLKTYTCDNLFLVGDIVDGWRLKQRWYWPQSHSNVVRRILTAAKRGTAVYYILGNHDEALRKFLPFELELGNIKLLDRYDYVGLDGNRYLVIHGDFFDSLMIDYKWLMHVGDSLYNFSIWLNLQLNSLRKLLKLEYWSLSNYLKQSAKQALQYISSYEQHLAQYCKSEGYNGVICGHIHRAEIKRINDVSYMNDGDWVESRTALLEHLDGRWELVYYETDTDSHGQSSDAD